MHSLLEGSDPHLADTYGLSLESRHGPFPALTPQSALHDLQDGRHPVFDDKTILSWTARELAEHVRAGDISASAATAAYLGQVNRVDPKIHAYLRVTQESAMARAEEVDARRARGDKLGALAGVPIALKDIFVTKGVETTCGSKILGGWKPVYQGTHAQRLEDADAVLLGKLTMDEFAMGSSNENTPFEPVCNPWSLDHVPGGSSGGSAASIAARTCAATLGTDTGGSIRQPASLCGVVGLKPTWGRVSRRGMIAFASSLDQAGPITRDVADNALMLQTIAGHDPLDATSLHDAVPDYLGQCGLSIAGLRIGLHRAALELDGLAPDVATAFAAAIAQLKELGATIVDIELPHWQYATACYYVLCTAEASSNLARYDGMRYGMRIDKDSLLDTYMATREEGFGPEVKRRIMLGTFVLRADSYEEYYGRAMKVRTLIGRDYDQAFAKCDVIASPTSPVAGFRLKERINDPLAMYLSDVFTIGANLAGLPAMSVPCGMSAAQDARPQLPIGLHLVAPSLREDTLFRSAAAYEAAARWRELVAPVTAEALAQA